MAKGYWVTSYGRSKDQLAACEAGLKERVVIPEFPSVEQAIAVHDGPGYRAVLRALGDGADREIRIVEGLEQAGEIDTALENGF